MYQHLLLSEKIDDQEQYSRHSCLIFEGLNYVDENNKNLSQEIINIVPNETRVKMATKIKRDDKQKPPNRKN